MEITKNMFKSYEGNHELIIKHSPHIRTIDVAQHILDIQNEVTMLKNIIEDLRTREKKLEV
tara:strand:- start:282 stop:464 length:183 start_codon:yes stop_codon:yes gene_type:complete